MSGETSLLLDGGIGAVLLSMDGCMNYGILELLTSRTSLSSS